MAERLTEAKANDEVMLSQLKEEGMSETEKIEYAPDYKSARSLIEKACPDWPGSLDKERYVDELARVIHIKRVGTEHQFLRDQIVEAARTWAQTHDDYISIQKRTEYWEAKDRLQRAVDALLQFEHESKEER